MKPIIWLALRVASILIFTYAATVFAMQQSVETFIYMVVYTLIPQALGVSAEAYVTHVAELREKQKQEAERQQREAERQAYYNR